MRSEEEIEKRIEEINLNIKRLNEKYLKGDYSYNEVIERVYELSCEANVLKWVLDK